MRLLILNHWHQPDYLFFTSGLLFPNLFFIIPFSQRGITALILITVADASLITPTVTIRLGQILSEVDFIIYIPISVYLRHDNYRFCIFCGEFLLCFDFSSDSLSFSFLLKQVFFLFFHNHLNEFLFK
jgi:hypothetical protein